MDDYRVLGRDIFVIDKYFRLYFKNALRQYGLSTTEAMVLLALYEKGGSMAEDVLQSIHGDKLQKSQEQIISELQYDKAAMTRIMQSLEGKSFVIRRENPKDSRSFLFSATEKADAFKPILIGLLRDWNQLLLNGVGDLEIVSGAIKRMADNAKQSIKGE